MKQFIKLSVILLFFISAHYNSYSQTDNQNPNWISVSETKQGEKWYIRDAYVKKGVDVGTTSTCIRVWTKIEQPFVTVNGVSYQNCYTLQLRSFDCYNSKTMLIEIITYNSAGDILEHLKGENYQLSWDEITPDSAAEKILKKVCSLFNN